MKWIIAIKFVCSGEGCGCEMQEARLGRALQWVELDWAKMAKHKRLQSRIVKWKWKWKSKGIIPEKKS